MLDPDDQRPDDVDYRKYRSEDLERYFGYRIKPTNTHHELLQKMTEYYNNNEKFMKKSMIDPGIRARNALLAIGKLIRQRRKEILDVQQEIRKHYKILKDPEDYPEEQRPTARRRL